jgi:hypothetical protein
VIPDVRTPAGAAAISSVRQNAGPGKYASSATDGSNTMCGTLPSAHWPRRIERSSWIAWAGSTCAQPMAM